MEKTNGDNRERACLVEEIRQLIKRVGWSQNKAAEVIHEVLDASHTEAELKLFQEKFKKQLQRSSTSIERLSKYLEILRWDSDVKRSGGVLNTYVPSGELSQGLSAELRVLSEEVGNRVRGEDIG
ncbi:hypothetical protein [Alcaligenes faecalis]|uniref:hypothetical protein n=1 Tax=Alcaligenes faecalis TaxID=511 RepID=UPI001EEF9ACE|nr:hypothetical protein [Alcaligenes faecalis]ULH05366.1 hypothetical protein MF263_11745 [Alcaligenes faecalis]